MRAAHRIASNTGAILVGRALGMGLSVATVFLLTAHLSKAEFGNYNFVFFYIGIFSVVTEMGMSPILVREISRNREDGGAVLGTAVFIKIGFALFSFLAALLLLPVIKKDYQLSRLVLIMGLQLFVYPLLTCTNIFKLELKMIYPTFIDLARNTVYLGGIWYVVTTPTLGLAHIFGLAVLTSFMIAGVLWWISRRYMRIRFVYRPEVARILIRASIPLGLSQLAIICYYRIDTVMLLNLKGEEAVGYYALAVKIAEVFNYFPSAFMVSVYPFLARFWHDNRPKFLEAMEMSIRSLLALGLLIGIIGSIFAHQIISMIPGGYGQSAGSLVYLIWAEVFIFLNMVFYNVLNAMNHERWNLWITLLMLAGNIGLNLVLIPLHSHQGASFATLATEAFGFVLLGSITLTLVRFEVNMNRLVRTLLAGGTLAILLSMIRSSFQINIPSFFGISLMSSVFYFGLLYLLRVIDLKELRRLLGRQVE